MAEEEKKEEENIGSFYMGRTRQAPAPKRLLPPGVLTVIALVALGGIVWYAYPRGAEKYTNIDVPLVKADTAPIKAAPADPGGMEVRHQDSTVFDPLQKNGGAEVEKLAPTPEEPVDKDQAIKAEDIKPVAASPSLPPKLDMQVKDAGNGTEKIIPQAEEVKAEPVAVPPVTVKAPVKTASAASAGDFIDYNNFSPGGDAGLVAAGKSVEPVTPAADVPVTKATPATKPTPAAKATKVSSPASAAGEKYEVQLGSYHEETDAKKDWARFQKKYAAQLGKLKMRLVKADIPGKGAYYRLRAGTVSKDRAHEICDALKADHGVGCILAK